ncbi:hypothetical protein FA13DRAFT_1303741 [Coprinellus micaceus]|uniref:Uncharacterized protein n=1 Tax=Coprinellus micaceus TaxID=71717 RepID=A0A4Y7SRN9_COPMI|nr:hypothetical protein FA13DRAFT_1303741 [Coprinellus micaceus]
MSSGQFVLPATVIRYIEAGVPQRQLDSVLHLSQSGSENGPFASLDALYHHILNSAHNPDNDPHMVVKWILSIRFALGPRTLGGPPPAKFWRQLLEDVDGELSYRLGPVSSLITVPQADNTSAPITIYHKSLTDFLSAKTRCGDLYVDDTELHSFVASRIVAILKHKGPVVSFVSPDHDFFKFLQYFRYLKLLAPAGSAPSSSDALILEHSLRDFWSSWARIRNMSWHLAT